MRLAGVVLAVLLIAACPPRRARVVYFQQYTVPSGPVTPIVPPPPVAKPTNPELDTHLTGWEQKTASVTSFRSEIKLARTDAAFKRSANFSGVVLCMKPNYAVLRLDNTGDPTKTDYEAYICDGKAVYAYNGIAKTVTEIKSPPKWPFRWLWASNNATLELLTGMKAQDMKERFDVTLFKTDENYVYLDIKPRSDKDQREFSHLRMALYGPGPNTAKVAYLPAKVYVLKPNGDTEMWTFTNPQVDLPGIEAKHFQYVEIRDKSWKLQKSPPEEGKRIPLVEP